MLQPQIGNADIEMQLRYVGYFGIRKALLNRKFVGSVLSWAVLLLLCGFSSLLGMDQTASKTFLDQRKTVPPRREWMREVLSRQGGSFNFKVSSQGAIGVTIVTHKGYKAIMEGDKKLLKIFEDILLTVDSKDGVFEGRVVVPAGSSHFLIENQTDNEAEIHLQCFIPGVGSDRRSFTGNTGKLREYSPQDLGLSIELPGDPIRGDILWPDAVRGGIKQSKAFTYNDQQISVFVIKFVSEKLSVSSSVLKDIAAGFLDSSAKRPGVSDVVKLAEMKDDSNLMMRSTFKDRGTYFEIRGSVHAKGNSAWLIVTKFVLGDEQATAQSLQIINSVKFDDIK